MSELIKNPQDMYPHMDYMRWDIINGLIKKHGYKSYLEIGVFNRELNFNKIDCKLKVGVDPAESAKADFETTSDLFFKRILSNPVPLAHNKMGVIGNSFDLIFIDGLHTGEQVYKDGINALECLNEGGTVIFHDMNPTSELMASSERKTRLWCGNCWEAWVQLRQERNDLQMHVIDTDFGVGVIQRGKQKKLKLSGPGCPISWDSFQENKKQWLNLISADEFKKLYL